MCQAGLNENIEEFGFLWGVGCFVVLVFRLFVPFFLILKPSFYTSGFFYPFWFSVMGALIGLNGPNHPHLGYPSTHPAHGPRTPAKLSSGQPVLGWAMSKVCLSPVLSLLVVCTSCLPCRYLVSQMTTSEVCCNFFLLLPLGLSLAASDWTPWIGLQICFSLSLVWKCWWTLLLATGSVHCGQTLWGTACVGVTLLTANLPLGSSLTFLVSDIRKLKVYTKFILNRCSYLFSQILMPIGLLHFYSPNNFSVNITDIYYFTVEAYWLIKSRTFN